MNSDRNLRLLTVVLRISGLALLAAFPAMLLPTDWMASTHARIGLGEFPRVALVEYLTRSIAALYGFHGVLVLLVARDPVRYRGIVGYISVMNVTFGTMMVAIDVYAGMPRWWTAFEGPSIVALGLVVAALNRRNGVS
jgi:hypothetical protein